MFVNSQSIPEKDHHLLFILFGQVFEEIDLSKLNGLYFNIFQDVSKAFLLAIDAVWPQIGSMHVKANVIFFRPNKIFRLIIWFQFIFQLKRVVLDIDCLLILFFFRLKYQLFAFYFTFPLVYFPPKAIYLLHHQIFSMNLQLFLFKSLFYWACRHQLEVFHVFTKFCHSKQVRRVLRRRIFLCLVQLSLQISQLNCRFNTRFINLRRRILQPASLHLYSPNFVIFLHFLIKERLWQDRFIKNIVRLLLPFHSYEKSIINSFIIDSIVVLLIDIISMKTFICLALCIVLIHCSNRPSPVKIPEVTNVYDKPWYSGYLDIPFEHYKAHVHYFYFPSQSATPEKDPVLFWFNGGPGCSSLLGALYEHGPFVFIDAFGSLVNNPEAWNKRAHTIYIESPAQVGFSYMDIEQGDTYPIWDDERTSNLNLAAVLNFFETFPEFQNRPTYLSGESYAGIYVPTLAYKIHRYNTEYRNTINLQGFAVGNGCTDRTECEFINDYPRYQIQLFNDLGILPDSDYDQIQKLCSTDVLTDECKHKMEVIDNMTAGINIYDAYRPCWQNNAPAMSFTDMLKQAHGIRLESQDQSNGWAPPCVDSEGIDKLLENQNNRKLLGIPDHVAPYAMCNNEKTFNYTRSTTGSYWVYEKLIPLNKYKIVKYSGDSDPAVPFSGTLMWINKLRKQLRLTTITYWKPWKVKISNGEQNSGSLWEFSNKFSLFRFKGVGHMAPQWNNQGGTKLINYVLFDEQP